VIGATAGCSALLIAAFSGAEPRTAWILAAATAALGVVTSMPGAALQGLQRWRDISAVVLTCGAAGAAATIAVLAVGGGVTGMIAVQLVTAAAIGICVTAIAMRRVRAVAPTAERPSDELRRKTLRYAGSAFAGSLVTLIVFRRSEFFFLQHWWNDRETALYSVAFSAATTLVLVPQALATVLSPAVATLLGAGQQERIRTGYGRSLRLLLIASLPVAAGALALAPEAVRLVYGPGFAATEVPLLVLLAPFPLIPLMTVSYALVVGLGKIRFPLVVGVGSATLNVALDLALIPGHAALGAAIANSCAQAATAIATLVYAVRLTAPVRMEAATVGRAALCSAVAGAAAWAALTLVGGAPGVVAGLLVGVALYAAAALRLRILPREDAAWVDESFGDLVGGRLGAAARSLATR
jgi:O-antigen/teichoic acid export membrane protein